MTTLFDAIFKVDHSQVDKASESVKKMGGESDAAAKAGEHLETIFKGMGGAVGEATEHISRFNNTIGKMLESMEHLATLNVANIGGLGEFASALIASTAVAAAFVVVLGAVGVAMAFEWAEKIEQANDLGQAFGYTATQAMLMAEAAVYAGSSLQAVEGMYQKVAKAAYNASDETQGTGAAFKSLGIDIKGQNGELKSAQELTLEAVEAWKNGKQTTEDLAATTAVLGKSWQQNLPAIEAVAAAQKISNELAKEGIGISTESTLIIEEEVKSKIRMHGILSDIGSKLVEIVIPAFTNLVNWFNKSYESGGLVAGVFGAITAATEILMIALKTLSGVMQILVFMFDSVGKGLGALGASLAAFVTGDFTGAKNVWAAYFDDVGTSAKDLNKSLNELMSSEDTTRTIKQNGVGNAGKEGGDTKAPRSGGIKNASGPESDPYQKYLDTLQKMLDTQNRLNESEMVEQEIIKLNRDFEKQRAEIAAHNEEVKRTGKGTLKEQITDTQRLVEIEAARAKGAAIVNQERNNLVQINDYQKLAELSTKYTLKIDDEIRAKRVSKEVIAEENAIKAIEIELEKEINELKNGSKGNLWSIEAENDLRSKSVVEINNVKASTERARVESEKWFSNGFDKYITSTGTLNQKLEDFVAGSLTNFSNTMMDLVVNGKNGFQSMIASMLQGLANLIFQLMVVTPLIKAMKDAMAGGGFGGLGGLFGGLFGGGGGAAIDTGVGSGFDSALWGMGMAEGGVVGDNSAGNSILVGEKGPERFVPKGAGTILPNSLSGGGSSGSTTMSVQNNITIQNTGNLGSPTEQQQLGRTITAMINQQVNDILQKAARPGGMNNRVSMAV